MSSIDIESPRLQQFHNRVAGSIPCEPEAARAELQRMHIPELLGRYVSWADRHVMPRPRRVITWEGFLRHGSPQAHWEAVQSLGQRIEAGEDLTPFLSDRIHRFGYLPAKGNNAKRRGVEWGDKDYALNAFDMHHLHLRANGSRELLYVGFSRNDAHFLMLGDHKSFDDGTLAQAVAKSRVGTPLEFKGVLGLEHQRSLQEQNQLQRYGIATAYQVDDHAAMGALLSAAGTSPLHTMHATRMLRTIGHLEPRLDEPGFARAWFEQTGKRCPAAPNFEWMMQHCDLCLVETASHVACPILLWRR